MASICTSIQLRGTSGYWQFESPSSLNKGGMIEVKRVQLSPGLWETSLFRTDLDGRFAVFKSISKHLDETRSDFEPVPAETNIQRAGTDCRQVSNCLATDIKGCLSIP